MYILVLVTGNPGCAVEAFIIDYTFFELSASFMNSHPLHIDHVARQ